MWRIVEDMLTNANIFLLNNTKTNNNRQINKKRKETCRIRKQSIDLTNLLNEIHPPNEEERHPPFNIDLINFLTPPIHIVLNLFEVNKWFFSCTIKSALKFVLAREF